MGLLAASAATRLRARSVVRDNFDPLRLSVVVEFAWRWLVVQAIGGMSQKSDSRSGAFVLPNLGLYAGARLVF